MSEIIRVENLVKSYRKGFIPQRVDALKGSTFSVSAGRITGFIGANGAGKTTTLRCLLGFTKIDSGHFSFFGSSGLDMSVRRRIGYLPEHPHFYSFLSGFEFLKFYASLSGVKRTKQDLLDSLKRVKLENAAERSLSSYSKGMLQRVGLAQALIHEPELLILDEPMSGLDPDGRRLVRDILLEVSKRGVTLFFSTHLLDDAENLCEDIVLMSDGKVPYCGDLKSILASSSEEFIVSYQTLEGAEQYLDCIGREKMNSEITRILSQGGKISEIHQKKKRLEDVFSQLTQSMEKTAG